jgi:Zn-dependent peptidase ImmA (M78 family)
MARPTSVKIFGQRYKIRYDYDSEDNNGLCEPDKNLIHISPLMEDDKLFRVLMHEIAHAVLAETLLRERKRFNEEEICDFVGFHYMDMLKENPALVEWLFREVEA